MNKLLAVLALTLAAGCANYSWRTQVPVDFRTVQVPGFRNSSTLTETGAVATRQVLREFQREGTFRILTSGAALEVQGEIVDTMSDGRMSSNKIGNRLHGGTFVLTASVSVIDKVNGRVLIDNREYTGETPYSADLDNTTAYRDASRRAADILAQKVVDDVLKLNFEIKTEEEHE